MHLNIMTCITVPGVYAAGHCALQTHVSRPEGARKVRRSGHAGNA